MSKKMIPYLCRGSSPFFQNVVSLLLPLLLFTLTSCASIPREAPELSAELGKRISAIEESHISLLRLFMDEKRAQVDQFLMREWVPLFSKEIFQEDLIRRTWTEVCTSGTDADKVRLMTMLGPKIQQRINDKRLELMKPLDDLERTIERRLRDDYSQVKSINNSLTSFLASAAEVSENRDRYLNMLGVSDQKITEALDKADKEVAALVSTKASISAIGSKVTDYVEAIDGIITKLKRGK